MSQFKDKLLWLGAGITIVLTTLVGVSLYGALAAPTAAGAVAPGPVAQLPSHAPYSVAQRAF